MRQMLLTGLILVETACTVGPRRVELPTPQPLAPRQQLEVWRERKARTLHAVVQTRDSLSGVPVHRPPSCDSCRVTLALAEIDSVRVVSIERAALMTHGLVLGFTAAALIAWRISDRD
jgi:hypothetical protein